MIVSTDFIRDHYGLVLTFGTTLGIYLLNLKLKYAENIPEKAAKSEHETWVWSSYIISLLHASVIGVLALLCVFLRRRILYDVDHYFEPAYLVVCLSTGYFFYDLVDEINHMKTSPAAKYIVHHVLALSFLFPVVMSKRLVGIAVTGLITEFHNVFLHSRVVIEYYGYHKSPVIKNSLGIANLLTCILCRLILFPYIAYALSNSAIVSAPILFLLYSELVYIFGYSLFIFVLSFRTDFPSKAC